MYFCFVSLVWFLHLTHFDKEFLFPINMFVCLCVFYSMKKKSWYMYMNEYAMACLRLWIQKETNERTNERKFFFSLRLLMLRWKETNNCHSNDVCKHLSNLSTQMFKSDFFSSFLHSNNRREFLWRKKIKRVHFSFYFIATICNDELLFLERISMSQHIKTGHLRYYHSKSACFFVLLVDEWK